MVNIDLTEKDEEFRVIDGYDNYCISNYGRCYSLFSKKFLKARDNGHGYLYCEIYKDGKRKKFYIYRLVALHFIPNPLNKLEVNHKDLNKNNNCVHNLEWVTPKENISHAHKNGAFKETVEKLIVPVIRYSNEGSIIDVFHSRIECSKSLNIKLSTVKECIRKNRKMLNTGFYFRSLTKKEFLYYKNKGYLHIGTTQSYTRDTTDDDVMEALQINI